MNKKLWFLLLVILLPVSIAALKLRPAPASPQVILWAWERPENLTFIDPGKVAVAFLAKTITLRGDMTLVRRRLQPLELPPDTNLIAVVRIETDSPSLSATQLAQTANEVSSLPVKSVQIDFDARLSERDFYRALLQEIRRDSPSVSLSITALASWCAGDNWLTDLPIDEAVPMLFRLGVEQRQFQRRLEAGRAFESPICQNAAGVSIDEPVRAPEVNRLYIFNPQPWSKDSFDTAMEAFKR